MSLNELGHFLTGRTIREKLRAARQRNNAPVEWEPSDVAILLQGWIDNEVDDKTWDFFESCEISNSELEDIRQQALDATLPESPTYDWERRQLNDRGRKLFTKLIERCKRV